MSAKKLLDLAITIVATITLAILVALAVVTVTSCGGTAPPLEEEKGQVVFWVPRPEGAEGCPDARHAGFRPDLQAVECEIFAPDKTRLGAIRVVGGQYYCSVPGGYVRCQGADGRPVWSETRGMCTFEGAVPECSQLEPERPGLPFLAPEPPDPT